AIVCRADRNWSAERRFGAAAGKIAALFWRGTDPVAAEQTGRSQENLLQLEIELLAIFRRSLPFVGGQREPVPETLGQPLRALQSKPFKMIVHVSVDGANIRELSLDFQG